MAAKKDTAPLRGAKLIKKAIESAKANGLLDAPEPLPLAKKLKLPNGESLSPGMKELLLADAEWLGIEFDEDEAEVEGASLEDVVEDVFGDEAIAAFGEAYELLSEDCVLFGADTSPAACLYVGTADDAGEYPVLQLTFVDGVARIGGFVPFDVWVAQELGGLERGKDIGAVPSEYASLPQAAADANGDGRLVFTPKAGEGGDADEDEDSDEEADDQE